MLARLFSNTVFNSMSIALRIAISLALTPFLIQHLGRPLYGLWVLALTFSVTGYVSLFSLGIQGALVKSVAAHAARGEWQSINGVFTAAGVAFSALGFVAATSVMIFGQFFLTRVFQVPQELQETARLVVTVIAIQALFDLPALMFSGVLEGLQRYDILSSFEVVRATAFAIVAARILREGYGVIAMAVTLISLSALVLIAGAVAAFRLLPTLRFTSDVDTRAVFSMARMSGHMFLLRLNAVIYGQMDKAILAIFITTTAVGDYDVISRFHSLVLVAMGLISSVVMPAAAALDAVGDRGRLRELFFRGTKYSAAISVPLSVMLIVLARPLLIQWVGPEFAGHAPLVALFLSYTLFFVLQEVGWNIMVGMGRSREILIIQVMTTAVNLAVSVFATKRFGLAGVFLGTVIGNACAAILYYRLYFRVIGVGLSEYMERVVTRVYPQVAVAGLLLWVFNSLRPPASLFEIALYGASYLGIYAILFLTTGADGNDRELLVVAFRRWLRSVGT